MKPQVELTIDIATCRRAQDGFDDIHILANGVVWQPALCDVIDCHLQAGRQHSTVMTTCGLVTSGKQSSPHTLKHAGRAQQCSSQTSHAESLRTKLA